MARRPKPEVALDTELAELPPELRWREWMGRVEAVIFAAPGPVSREVLAQVVGRDCAIDLIIADIREELRGRPYDLVAVAGGWQHRTRGAFAPAVRVASGAPQAAASLSQTEMLFLSGIAYLQPITRSELGKVFGKEMSRDIVAALKRAGVITAGPRSPEPGAPYTYVTTETFLSVFGLASLRDLPDLEKLEDAGLLTKDTVLAEEIPIGGGDEGEVDAEGDGLANNDLDATGN
ncbi:SMC-Scp complex subunit ScpB [Bosea sp. BIWAKO-01]|uniref:SMC-Scp complex subunit ScpB n=1 Tax=Bosea sp. BIWAKO-01 TaxID=506668 RepID=UPI000852BD74|nr:SMC-Scp complex subunit ScpB [Bosea sp. BIWAKO-01]GAU86923.1 segregation and condensation protein B [Bosea sp. BIWAKO-01]